MIDLIIIGAGTAGMTAAVYALRNNKTVKIIESTSIGGQIAFSPKVENLPSYRQISGEEFSNKLFEQVLDLGATFELEDVKSVEKVGDTFIVQTDMNKYESRAVIIATGVKQRHIGIKSEDYLLGKGVYYCAICDGAFYKGKEVAVIGDGNTAMQSAMLLSAICTKVHLLTLFDKFFGDESLALSVRNTENIIITPNVSVVDFIGKDKLQGLKVQRAEDKSEYTLYVPAVFVAIGQIPDNKKFENLAELDKDGYFATNADMTTKTEGLYVAGDCNQKKIRQLCTAINDGAVAALSAVDYLNRKK